MQRPLRCPGAGPGVAQHLPRSAQGLTSSLPARRLRLQLLAACAQRPEVLEAQLATISADIKAATVEEYLKGLEQASAAEDLRSTLASPIFQPTKQSTRLPFQDKETGLVLEERWVPRADLRAVTPEGTGREVLLQAFNWESHKGHWWRDLPGKAAAWAKLGITAAWLPPPSCSVAPQGYMPLDLYNLNSAYGAESDLRNAVRALQGAGITPVCDIVINHRCAAHQDERGMWNHFGGKLAWDAAAIVGDDPKFGGRGGLSSGVSFEAAPNLDHSQPFVKSDLTAWLCWLRDHIGFRGWRFDFSKGYAGCHVADYVARTAPEFVVGEFWDSLAYDGNVPKHDQDSHRQRLVDWLSATGGGATAFDFTTKGILHAAFEKGELWRLRDSCGLPPGLLGWWPSRAVTFLENHDTGSTQGHWRFPAKFLEEGHVYMLTHPGTPALFLDHVEDPKLALLIGRLLQLRTAAGIHCRSKVTILEAHPDLYVASVDGALLMKLGPGEYAPPAGEWALAQEGKRWQVWLKPAPGKAGKAAARKA